MVLYYILLPLAWLVFHIGFRVECVGRENLKKVQTVQKLEHKGLFLMRKKPS